MGLDGLHLKKEPWPSCLVLFVPLGALWSPGDYSRGSGDRTPLPRDCWPNASPYQNHVSVGI